MRWISFVGFVKGFGRNRAEGKKKNEMALVLMCYAGMLIVSLTWCSGSGSQKE